MTSQDIRQKFLDYFAEHRHHIIPSASLIPIDDPTLLFTNAGMVPFKDVFLGIEQRAYTRATSVQRCLRAGGKHNDLENVGYTGRHHTFFEMLGNFSFGDYFKKEAIILAWEFLTKILHIPPEKLWITVFNDDAESEAIWLHTIRIDPTRISHCDEKDNFWQMGDTGPCGPCTEIFYDHGPDIAGGPPGSPESEGDRYVEIWNLVFMQYARQPNGDLQPLPKPCVDTGMGLERVAAVLQGVHDNYDTDIFQYLLSALCVWIPRNKNNKSMRVIADHIRAVAFLIMDGVVPSNEGRGYVLRRIIRRAVRHGAKLGQSEPFFYQMVTPLIQIMGDAYPELKKIEASAKKIIYQEEEQFAKTLMRGLKKLEEAMVDASNTSVIAGELVFQLYDTYGFPPDLTADIARERGLRIDQEGFDCAMENQRALSHRSQHFNIDHTRMILDQDKIAVTEFVGYEYEQATANVIGIFTEDFRHVLQLVDGERGILLLNKTPFYAEAGGQVGDRGHLEWPAGRFDVIDTQKQGDLYLHIGYLIGSVVMEGQSVQAIIDHAHRTAIRANHTATHLLHEALRRVLGDHVVQKGSSVRADRLRFDFLHTQAMTLAERHAVEWLVNTHIRANHVAETSIMTPELATRIGAMALFNERYGDSVRVLKMGDFSMEICGGTHVIRTGDIGLCTIISEAASAAGVRRIEAVTGAAALGYIHEQQRTLVDIGGLLKTNCDDIPKKIMQLLHTHRTLEQSIAALQQQWARQQLLKIEHAVVNLGAVRVLSQALDHLNQHTLRTTIDQLKQQINVDVIVLATVDSDKIYLVSAVATTCLLHFNAIDLLNHVAQQVGGKAGGRPDRAQGGGVNVGALDTALNSVVAWVESQMPAACR